MLSRIEQKILRKIRVPSENNPLLPEFPPEDPQFPATPTYKIKVPGFSNVWLKDESVNPTGTHKDRMAWEIVVTYRNFLLAKKRGQVREPLPAMSVISSGSAAIAIQTQLHHYGLPELRVLADKRLDAFWVRAMKKTGCKLYFTDLTKKALGSKDILALTQNTKGFDITSGAALDPSTRFYDWMSYEVVNQSPDYCFIPFGTGHLYENVLNVNKREISARPHDPRHSQPVDQPQRDENVDQPRAGDDHQQYHDLLHTLHGAAQRHLPGEYQDQDGDDEGDGQPAMDLAQPPVQPFGHIQPLSQSTTFYRLRPRRIAPARASGLCHSPARRSST